MLAGLSQLAVAIDADQIRVLVGRCWPAWNRVGDGRAVFCPGTVATMRTVAGLDDVGQVFER